MLTEILQQQYAVFLVILKPGQHLALPSHQPAAIGTDAHSGDIRRSEGSHSAESGQIAERSIFYHQFAPGLGKDDHARCV